MFSPVALRIKQAITAGVELTLSQGEEISGAELGVVLRSTADTCPRGLWVTGLTIVGTADLDSIEFDGPLDFDHCTFADGLWLTDSSLRRLAIRDCTILTDFNGAGISADGLITRSDVFLVGESTRIAGCVELRDGKLGGQLNIRDGAQIGSDEQGKSLKADGLSTGSDLFIEGASTRLSGSVQLQDATIGGQMAIRNGVRIGADNRGQSVNSGGISVRTDYGLTRAPTKLDGGILLDGARIGGQIVIEAGVQVGSDLGGHSVHGIGCTSSAALRVIGPRTQLAGGVRLSNSRIEGGVRIDAGAVIGQSDGYSLDAEGLVSPATVVLDGASTRLDGAIDLARAEIRNQVVVQGGALIGTNSVGDSIHADALRTGDIRIGGETTVLAGGVRLHTAEVSGQVSIVQGVSIGHSERGESLLGIHLSCVELFIEDTGASVTGQVQLSNADIGSLTISTSTVNSGAASLIGLDLDQASVRRSLILGKHAVVGFVSLVDATIDTLDEQITSWEVSSGWRLDGFNVRRFADPSNSALAAHRLEWLALGSGQGSPASRGVYRSIADAYRRSGNDEHAVDALVAMRTLHDQAWVVRLLRPIRQGYALGRALAVFAGLSLFVVGLTVSAAKADLFVAIGEGAREAEGNGHITMGSCERTSYPCLQSPTYALDVIIPIVDLEQTEYWAIGTTNAVVSAENLIAALLSLSRLLGWIVGGVGIVGAARLINEQRHVADL